METAETRAKLADAIRQLQSAGKTEDVNRLVSAYKAKYQSAPSTTPETTEASLGRKVFDFFTSSTQALGTTGGESLAASSIAKPLEEAQMLRSDIRLDLTRRINQGRRAGEDVSRLEKALSDLNAETTPTLDTVAPATTKTTSQVVGEGLGTLLEATTGGILSGITKKTVAKTAAQELAERTASKTLSTPQRIAQIGKSTAKNVSQALPFGYTADVALGLQAGETPKESLNVGMGTALALGIPLTIGGVQAARVASQPVLRGIASNLSGVEKGAYEQVAKSGRDLIGKTTTESAYKDTRAAVRAFNRAVSEEWRDSTKDIVETFTGKRIGLGDNEIASLTKIAERFGFADRLPQNLKSLSAKESIDLLTEINAIPKVSKVDDPLVRSFKINLSEIKNVLRDNARQAFGGEGGKFDALYSNYTRKQKIISDISSVIGKVSADPTPTQIQTAQNRLMSVFKENRGEYLKAIQAFEDETGTKILDKVAAAQLSNVLPKSLRMATGGSIPGVPALLTDVIQLITLPLSSPRAGSFLIDYLAGNTPGISTALLNLSPKVRAAIYNAVVGENMAFDDAVRLYAREAYEAHKNLPNKQGGFINLTADIPATYKGEKDLTTKILKDLEGKTTVSKQYILDATNRGELKQVERDLIRQALEKEGTTVNVADFAKKVKAELLPLQRTTSDINASPKLHNTGAGRYENIALPDEVRGKVKKYTENIYQSPIKTSAGATHFSQTSSPNYFGHTRIEDMADNKTRRVIEVQSDLYQKGGLENERQFKTFDEALQEARSRGGIDDEKASQKLAKQWWKEEQQLSKLEQYNDPTAHFRMIREEIKKASQDGKTKLQFPTGETAMKIEGLGGSREFWNDSVLGGSLKIENLEVGKLISQGLPNGGPTGNYWIITDVLGDGKFKAVPKDNIIGWENEKQLFEQLDNSRNWTEFKGNRYLEGVMDDIFDKQMEVDDLFAKHDFDKLSDEVQRQYTKTIEDRFKETFDISGKVDTSNPIYKFYEKEVSKYLNKFGGKRVVDSKGVSWIEVPITKEQGKMPVEAFGLVPFAMTDKEDKIK